MKTVFFKSIKFLKQFDIKSVIINSIVFMVTCCVVCVLVFFNCLTINDPSRVMFSLERSLMINSIPIHLKPLYSSLTIVDYVTKKKPGVFISNYFNYLLILFLRSWFHFGYLGCTEVRLYNSQCQNRSQRLKVVYNYGNLYKLLLNPNYLYKHTMPVTIRHLFIRLSIYQYLNHNVN